MRECLFTFHNVDVFRVPRDDIRRHNMAAKDNVAFRAPEMSDRTGIVHRARNPETRVRNRNSIHYSQYVKRQYEDRHIYTVADWF